MYELRLQSLSALYKGNMLVVGYNMMRRVPSPSSFEWLGVKKTVTSYFNIAYVFYLGSKQMIARLNGGHAVNVVMPWDVL